MKNFSTQIREICGNNGMYLLRAKAKRFPRKFALYLLWRSLINKDAKFTYYWDDEQQITELEIVRKIFKEIHPSVSLAEAFQIYTVVRSTQKIGGDIAEVGVYRGGTAKVICLAREQDKLLHLFDTFEGLPEPGEFDDAKWKKGGFMISDKDFEKIKKYFEDEKNVYFHKGIFPKTSSPVKDSMFSFVHLDVDIYESTMDCLEFFYPRMNKGGIILSHDYHGASGVKQAFNEFFGKKLEPIVELSTSQCLIVKD